MEGRDRLPTDDVLVLSEAKGQDSTLGLSPSAGQAWAPAEPAMIATPTSTRSNVLEERFNRSCFAKIANNEKFQNLTLSIIVINALWIMVDTEWNHANIKLEDGSYPLQPTSTVIENLFCGYFTLEVFIRFCSYKKIRYCCTDAWFVFDSFLVSCMILETWVLVLVEHLSGGGGGASALSSFSALRLLRLLRLTRMARLMRQVPELMVLVKGILAAAMSVIWILLFLVMVMYVFAIVFTSTYGDPLKEPEEETAHWIFGSMGDSMMTLFTNGVLGDNLAQTVDIILAEGEMMFWVFFVFFCISSMTLLNMLIGVLCEVIGGTAEEEKGSMQETGIRLCLEEAFLGIDQNCDGTVSEKEWSYIKNNSELHTSFIEAGWDEERICEQLDQMQTTMFPVKKNFGRSETTALDLEQLCTKVIEIRPSKAASLLDLKLLKARSEMAHEKAQGDLQTLEDNFKELLIAKKLPLPDFTRKRRSSPTSPRPHHDVPTHQLLQELKKRAPQAPQGPGAGQPNNFRAQPKPAPAPPPPGRGQQQQQPPQQQQQQRQQQQQQQRQQQQQQQSQRTSAVAAEQRNAAVLQPDSEWASSPPAADLPGIASRGQVGRPPPVLEPDYSAPAMPQHGDVRVSNVSSPDQTGETFNFEGEPQIAGQQSEVSDGAPAWSSLSPVLFERNRVASQQESIYEQGVDDQMFHGSGEDYQWQGQPYADNYQGHGQAVPSAGSQAAAHEQPNQMRETTSSLSAGRVVGPEGMPISRPLPVGVVSNVQTKASRKSNVRRSDFHANQLAALENGDEADDTLRVSAAVSMQPQQHPLFNSLIRRQPPGGWSAARCVAAQLEHSALALPELSKRARIRTVSDLRALLLELPELFDFTGPPDMVDLRFPDNHVHGCPWCDEGEYDANARLQGCHCVWRLCDALLQTDNHADNSGLWGAMPPRVPPRPKPDGRTSAARPARARNVMSATA